ncbi:hypothetical protein GUITHDRAFT_116009 [Guillardia theta CCMP2712]|uniref:Uncharacterized protein n=2 Tax=Guillardia theta TaxID=55529 RepID=L1INN8_GUITC|nr:hypothetical protein GUITHDRAFT_116009 [Guillardia theta CCMP2712]EKX37868.1 hypothetical protein GUITHDRAFT_116009 [Guillardia theta CCMP2712]|eukprot:XP_005824848.1 hypothetical protein GUITHDRAFT_116009 [Guillardia theta CCMP2712]
MPRSLQASEPDGSALEALTVHALTNPKMLPKIVLYLEKIVSKKFARREQQQLQCAVKILLTLIQTCHLELRRFSENVVRVTKFLLRQVELPELYPLGCEVFIKFASYQDGANLSLVLSPFIDDIVRLSHDSQTRPDLRLSIREAGLKAMAVVVRLLDLSLAEHFAKLMPAILVNMNVPSSLDGEGIDRRVKEAASRLFRQVCQCLRPALSQFILKPFFSYLDGTNAWSQGNDVNCFAVESLKLLMASMEPQHNYLLFLEMSRRVEGCNRARADLVVTLCIVRAIAAMAGLVQGTPGPSFYKIFTSILSLFSYQLEMAKKNRELTGNSRPKTSLSPVDKMKLLEQAFRQAAEANASSVRDAGGVLRILDECQTCFERMGGAFSGSPQHLDAMQQLIERAAAVTRRGEEKSGEGGEEGEGAREEEEDSRNFLLGYYVRALKALVNEGILLPPGKNTPSYLIDFIINLLSASSPSLRDLAVGCLRLTVCCVREKSSGSCRDAAWHEHLSPSDQLNIVKTFMLGMTSSRATPQDLVRSSSFLSSLARSGPERWVELVLPWLMEMQRSISTSKQLEDAQEEAENSMLHVKPLQAMWLHSVIASCILSLAHASKNEALASYVHQVLAERRQPGMTCRELRMNDEGELELVSEPSSQPEVASEAKAELTFEQLEGLASEDAGGSTSMALLDVNEVCSALGTGPLLLAKDPSSYPALRRLSSNPQDVKLVSPSRHEVDSSTITSDCSYSASAGLMPPELAAHPILEEGSVESSRLRKESLHPAKLLRAAIQEGAELNSSTDVPHGFEGLRRLIEEEHKRSRGFKTRLLRGELRKETGGRQRLHLLLQDSANDRRTTTILSSRRQRGEHEVDWMRD